MWHLALHVIVPLGVALSFYRERWASSALILLATMAVDADHLLADPVYDPARCSIGFHPLHTVPAIGVYAAMFALPPLLDRRTPPPAGRSTAASVMHLAGLGLLIHMALDGIDCLA